MAEEDDKPEATPTVEAELSDAEVRARERGWVPKDEYKGKSDYWVTAEEWLEKAPKTYIPTLEKKIGKLEGQLAKAETEFQDRLQRVERAAQSALKRQREILETEYEAKKEKAVETGDTDAYRAAVKAEKAAVEKLTDKAENAAEESPDAKLAKLSKAEREWYEENPWFGKDAKLTRYAKAISEDVEDDMPAASQAEKLAEIRERVSEQFPDKFGKKGNGASRVEGGSRSGAGGNGRTAQGWNDLPSDVRKVAERQIKEGLFKDHTDYAKEYWKEVADA